MQFISKTIHVYINGIFLIKISKNKQKKISFCKLHLGNSELNKIFLNDHFGSIKSYLIWRQNESLVLAGNLRGAHYQLNELQKFTLRRITQDLKISNRCLATLLLSCHPEKRRNQAQDLRPRLLVMGFCGGRQSQM